ncbi:hypothetical protein EJB05_43251, partial [Eragrostis curvula]
MVLGSRERPGPRSPLRLHPAPIAEPPSTLREPPRPSPELSRPVVEDARAVSWGAARSADMRERERSEGEREGGRHKSGGGGRHRGTGTGWVAAARSAPPCCLELAATHQPANPPPRACRDADPPPRPASLPCCSASRAMEEEREGEIRLEIRLRERERVEEARWAEEIRLEIFFPYFLGIGRSE